MKKILVFITTGVLLFSCTKELAIKEGDIDGIVLNSIISSDSIIQVNISQVNGIANSEIQYLNNLKVELFENDSLIGLLNNTAKGWYTTYYKPTEGKRYDVKVNYAGKMIKAKTIVPKNVEIINATYSLFDFVNDAGENYKVPQTIIKFIDNGQSNNYYEVFLAHYGIYQIDDHINSLSFAPLVDCPILLNEGDENYYPNTYFFSDELFNGDTCMLSFYDGGTAMEIDGHFQDDDKKTDVILRSISKEYYLYRKYWTRHYFNQQNAENIDDPLTILFQGIPVDMYSNVTGAYGIDF